MGLTYGQLVDAANAKRIEHWDPWSILLTLTYNANRGEKDRAMQPEDWHPHRKSKKKKRKKRSNYTASIVANAHERLAKERPVKILKNFTVI